MNPADTWLTVLWLTVATILTRCSFFLLGRHAVRLPPKLQHALRYAPAAALAAIVAPDLMLGNGDLAITWANPKLMAAVGAIMVFLTTRHLLGTIIAGMALFSLLRITL